MMDREKPRTPTEANILTHEAPEILLFSAMVEDTPDYMNLRQKYGIPENTCLVDVELKVNGVPVPFREVLGNAWKRFSKTYDEAVLEKATELVTQTQLNEVQEVLDRMRSEVEGYEFELQRMLKAKFEEQR